MSYSHSPAYLVTALAAFLSSKPVQEEVRAKPYGLGKRQNRAERENNTGGGFQGGVRVCAILILLI